MELLLKKWFTTAEILFPTILVQVAITVDGRQLPCKKIYL
jgi:hypothetical protein